MKRLTARELMYGKVLFDPPKGHFVGAGGKVYTVCAASTSRSRVWSAWLLSDFLGVFTWTLPGGLYKRNARHLLVRRLENNIPDVGRRLILRAVKEV